MKLKFIKKDNCMQCTIEGCDKNIIFGMSIKNCCLEHSKVLKKLIENTLDGI